MIPIKNSFFELETAPKEYTSNLVIDKNNDLWCLVNFSLCKYTVAENRFENLKTTASCISLDADMNLWMGDNDGNIRIYDPKNAKPAMRSG